MRICSSIPKHPTVQAHTDNHKILPRAHMLQRFFWNPVRVSTKHLFLCLLLSWKKEGQDLQLVQTSTDTLKIKTLCTVQPWYQLHISSAKLQVVLIRWKPSIRSLSLLILTAAGRCCVETHKKEWHEHYLPFQRKRSS